MIGVFAFIAFAAAAAEAPAKPADPLDRVKCVREEVTGSLASYRKVCHTVREWNAITRDGNAEARRLLQPGSTNDLNK